MDQAGPYNVSVSNAYGGVTSYPGILTVVPLTITTQPTGRVAWLNGSATFKVNVSGMAPFTFKWQCNNVDVPGLNTNVLTLTNLQPSQFGTYSVIVSNAYGGVTSRNATLLLSEVAVWGGSNGETNLPTGLTNIIAISGGSSSCLALKSNGTPVGWPSAYSGSNNLIAIAGANPSMGLQTNGNVVYSSVGLVSGLTNIVAIAPRIYGYLALRNDGTVIGNASIAGLSNMVAIAEGNGHSLALKIDGTVVAWGAWSYGQTNVPAGLSNVTAIAAGYNHSLALKADSTVIAWGRNLEHQTNVPAGLSNVVAIAAGGYHSLALKNDGTVVSWGNGNGQTNVPAGLTNVVAIAGGQYTSLALIGNGPPVLQVPMINPVISTNNFSLSLPTQSGRVYVLQYKNLLSESNWTDLPLLAGNGGTILLTDTAANNSQRFYRVLRW